MFCHFWQKSENTKWPPFLGRGNFFENCRVPSLDILWVENCDEIALSRTVKEIEAILCFAIFGKNSKIQNGRHFWGGENFLKIKKNTFLRYPVVQKFRRNCEISQFVFCHFWQKSENSKWPPFLGRGKFFENCKEYLP